MDDISGSGDPGVDAFVDANLSSFAAWDVVVYLEHCDGVGADVADLVGRLGRRDHEVEPVLRDLASRGIVVVAPSESGGPPHRGPVRGAGQGARHQARVRASGALPYVARLSVRLRPGPTPAARRRSRGHRIM